MWLVPAEQRRVRRPAVLCISCSAFMVHAEPASPAHSRRSPNDEAPREHGTPYRLHDAHQFSARCLPQLLEQTPETKEVVCPLVRARGTLAGVDKRLWECLELEPLKA